MDDKSQIFRIATILNKIDDEHFTQFAEKKLGVSENDLKDIETECSAKKRELTIDKWLKKVDITDACSKLKNLVDKFCNAPKRKATQSISLDANRIYPLKQGRGCALIIVNSFKWNKNISRKTAAESDLKLMKNLWTDILGCDLFRGKLHADQTAKQMKTLLQEFSTPKEEYDYVVIVISTHGGLITEEILSEYEVGNGNEGEAFEISAVPKNGENHGSVNIKENNGDYILRDVCKNDGEEGNVDNVSKGPHIPPECDNTEEPGQGFDENFESVEKSLKESQEKNKRSTVEVFWGNDYKPVSERNIKKYFHNDKTSSGLRGVPKFFILDYCRGPSHCHIVSKGRAKSAGYTDGATGNEKECEATSPMPAVSDVLIAYATHPEFVAYERKSSWLIRIIHDIFKKHYLEEHAATMLTMVNNKMKDVQSTDGAMSMFESSLVKEFYFV